MDWKDLAADVSKFAPAIGGALGGPAGGAVGTVLASVFGAENDAQAVSEAIQADPQAAAKLKAAEMDHAAQMRRMVLEAETSRLAEVNKTYRREVSSEDGYVRRARPTFLYVVAFSIAVEVLIAVLVVVMGESLADLATLYQALSIPQGIAAGMCGVYLKKRSDDKAVASGQQPKGLLDGLMPKLRR